MEQILDKFQDLNLSDIPDLNVSINNDSSDMENISFDNLDYSIRNGSANDFHKMRLHSDFSCVTFNIGCVTKPKTPTRDCRKTMLSGVLKTLAADLYFIQECPWDLNISKHIKSLDLAHLEVYGSGKQLIILNSMLFDGHTIRETIINRFNDGLDRGSYAVYEISYKDRASVYEISYKDRARAFSFLAFSWHAGRRGEENEKFIEFCVKLSREMSLPFIVGGDFNCELNRTTEENDEEENDEEENNDYTQSIAYSEFVATILKRDDVEVFNNLYIPTQICYRYLRSIDFFVCNDITEIQLYNVAEVPITGKMLGTDCANAINNLGEITVKNVVDHLPVFAYCNTNDRLIKANCE